MADTNHAIKLYRTSATSKSVGINVTDSTDTTGYALYVIGSTYVRGNVNLTGSGSRYKYVSFYQSSGSNVGYIRYDSGNATNVTTGKFRFQQYSGNATATTSASEYYESFSLPTTSQGLTASADYVILTDKTAVTITQGGTGARTTTDAQKNLGILPIFYSALDFTVATTDPGIYTIAGTTNPVTSTAEYGSAIQFSGQASGTKHYGAQLIISSASGATSAVHAYIRRMTSTPAWSTWSTIFDNRSNLIPDANTTYNIGSSSYKYSNVYATTFNGALSGNATNVTGTVAVGNGGTGKTSWTAYGVLYASSSSALTNTAAGAANTALMGKGSAAPAFVSVSPSCAWTDGTTSGPTLKVTVLGVTQSTGAAIPAASTSASGIVTTGEQQFRGKKKFDFIQLWGNTGSGASRYPGDIQYFSNSGTMVAESWYDMGNATNVTTGQFGWREYSPNSTASTTTTGKHETYYLPAVTTGLSESVNYNIFTTKTFHYHDSNGALYNSTPGSSYETVNTDNVRYRYYLLLGQPNSSSSYVSFLVPFSLVSTSADTTAVQLVDNTHYHSLYLQRSSDNLKIKHKAQDAGTTQKVYVYGLFPHANKFV